MIPAVPEVLLFVHDAGGGHRAAANALIAAARHTHRHWRFRVLALQVIFDHLDLGRRLTGRSTEEIYNILLRRHWTIATLPLLRILQTLIAVLHGPLVRSVARSLTGAPPAAAVSVVANFNRVLREAVRAVHPGIPFLVVLTDFADFPPRFWIDQGVDRVIAGSDRAVAQAVAAGVPRGGISRTSGMVLHPRFYPRATQVERARIRRELGLGADELVTSLLFGGKGSPEMLPLAAALLTELPCAHVIAICGDNPALFAGLGKVEATAGGRLHRVGFTERVAEYLSASDVLVTKPGPGSLAEAFHQRVPVVVVRNGHTLPQERFNTDFVAEREVGLVVRHWRDIPEAVATLGRDRERLGVLRANVSALEENRAVWEVIEIIEKEAVLV